MQHEIKKITKIIDEMLTMLLLKGKERIEVKVETEQDKTTIDITEFECDLTQDEIERFNNDLNVQRQHEVEGYYWQLTGEDDTEDELFLVGSMIDEAIVESKNNNLHIRLVRYR